MRCAYSAGSQVNLRQCPETATHQRIYTHSEIPHRERLKPCCFEHRFAKGDEGRPARDRGYLVERLDRVVVCARSGCHRAAGDVGAGLGDGNFRYCSTECRDRDLVSPECDGMTIDLGHEPVKLAFAPPPEVTGQPTFIVRDPEIAIPTLLLLLELATCALKVSASITCDELKRVGEDRCPVCRMKDTVTEHVVIPERAS